MKKLVFSILFALGVLAAHAQTSIGVGVHRVVAENETFNVTFTIKGDKQAENFSWEPGEGFEFVWGPSKGRSVSTKTVNGKTMTSAESTYTYTLRAVSVGKFTVPRASAKVAGHMIYSNPVEVEVVPSKSSSQQSSGGTQQNTAKKATESAKPLILKMEVDRTKTVVGEPLTVTFKLYSRVSVIAFDGFYPPSFSGFKSQELTSSSGVDFSRELYEGEIYEMAEIVRYRLFPQRQGKIEISPAELICTVSDRMGFHHYRVASEGLTVNVLELPSGAPESFGDGIGQFTISARLSSDEIKTHEVGSLFVTISGEGNVAFLEAPKVNFPSDMEVYDVKSEDRIDKSGLSGSKTFEYPFIPRSHGDFVIGPIEYSFYDTEAGKYVTISAPAMNLTVEKGSETAAAGPVMVSGVLQKDVATLGKDIRFINLDDDLAPKGDLFVLSLSFWILTLLILIAGLAVWFVLRKMNARKGDVVGTKKRKATKMAFRRLRIAESFLKQNLQGAFYEELHKAMLGYVADKLSMPLADLSRERISEVLASRGVSNDIVERFVALVDACEYARYSPDAGSQAMSEHYEDALDVISSIDSEIKTTKGMKKMYVGLLLFILPVSANASVDSLWNAANKAYIDGHWEEAVGGYEKISDQGYESPALYCNIGNAAFKSGDLSKAILNYERALKLDPSYEDAAYNLELASSQVQDKIESIPEFFLKRWFKEIAFIMGSDAWAVLFLVFLLLTVGLVLFFVFARTKAGRVTGFSVGILTLLLAIASLSFSIWQRNSYMAEDEAVVMVPYVSAKSSPSVGSAQELFILHEGTKVKVIDKVAGWNNIELSDGRQGWVPASDIEII